MPGSLALILHAHLPFVRHPEHEHFLEEDWFFEAITECYVPLVRMMQRLVDDHVPFMAVGCDIGAPAFAWSTRPRSTRAAIAARAQVLIGRDVYVDLFGAEPVGFWLPECAYGPGLESTLQEANIRWFVLDTHGLLF